MAEAKSQYEQLLHKTYAESRPMLDSLLAVFEKQYPAVEDHLAAWKGVRAFGTQHDDHPLELMADFFYLHVYRYLPDDTNDSVRVPYMIAGYKTLFADAEQFSYPEMQALSLKALAEIYNWNLQNYDASFECCYNMAKILENVPDQAFPDKKYCLYFIGNMYSRFQEFQTALTYLRQALAVKVDTTVPRLVNDQMNTLNAMGTCFSELAMIDSSDYYFNRIINETIIPNDHIWKVITRKHLAQNMYNRGEYDKAIPLLQQAVDKMSAFNDYAFAASSAVLLANIYMKQNKLKQAREMLWLADSYRSRTGSLDWVGNWFASISRYYLLSGQMQAAVNYQDSAFIAEKEHYHKLNAIQLLRNQQHQWSLDQKLQKEAFTTEQLQKELYYRGMIFLSVGAILLLLGMGFCLWLYTRNRAAYRELVRKSQEWALKQMDEAEVNIPHVDEVSDSREKLMNQVHHLFDNKRIFTDSNLTLGALADLLDTNRSYLSDTINRATGKHFNLFINEYRVKEAIRKLSDPDCDKYSIDQIAGDTGFSTRKTFYEAFKKATGLSPTDFKKNRDNEV